ncbi:MAG: hypothetical protein HYT73_02645 [Candidatus Aenigmarchaeota archaeon]|nr:hypothetical protein [Candidatus Aenigmarchaeota archaeon]
MMLSKKTAEDFEKYCKENKLSDKQREEKRAPAEARDKIHVRAGRSDRHNSRAEHFRAGDPDVY